jgi:hypothetical protein
LIINATRLGGRRGQLCRKLARMRVDVRQKSERHG